MNCKHCNREINEIKFVHFSNQIAQRLGYCWYGCMLSNLGKEKALKRLEERRIFQLNRRYRNV
ncbi:MAG: hypothetical protein AMJ73_10255 [candidate division Zixibacteria bacterium SM1_73]|nr:MAG: hypothetical protein AMJ73_10255 [candidate division Zixibacteria bacterium SM1_73]